jgi:hypothetical protein
LKYAETVSTIRAQLDERSIIVREQEELETQRDGNEESKSPNRLYRNYQNKKMKKKGNRTMIVDQMPYEGRKIKKRTLRMLSHSDKTRIVFLAVVKAYKHEFIADMFDIKTQHVSVLVNQVKKVPNFLEKIEEKEEKVEKVEELICQETTDILAKG